MVVFCKGEANWFGTQSRWATCHGYYSLSFSGVFWKLPPVNFNQLSTHTCSSLGVGQLRWERFAPGQVRAIAVAKAKAKALPGTSPKKRGSKRKEPALPEEPQANGEAGMDGIFQGRQLEACGVALPPHPSKDDHLPVNKSEAFGGHCDDGVVEIPFPERATFAGRARGGSLQHQKFFDERRQRFYQSTPPSFWKDNYERIFWNHCVEGGNDLDLGVSRFLDEIGIKAPANNQDSAKSPAVVPTPKAKAKGTAKPKATPRAGRGRARGRGRGGRGRVDSYH